MAVFSYKAVDHQGAMHEGKREAPDQFALYRELRKEGLNVVSSKIETIGQKFSFSSLAERFNSVTIREKINFARNTGSMLEAGLSLSRILAVIEKQSSNKGFKKIVTKINESVKGGNTFGDALAEHPSIFPRIFVSMVRAGEEGGTLARSLADLSNQMEHTYLLQKKLKGAMIYPAIILCLMVIIGILMLVYVVPSLTSTFKEMQVTLPLSTRIVVGISDFFRNNAVWAGLTFLIVSTGSGLFIKSDFGKRVIDQVMLHTPLIGGITREFNSARTARTLASLLSSGVDFVVAVEITQDVVQHRNFRRVLGEVKEKIQKGEPISEVFLNHTNLYPIFVGEMVSVGEETGQLAGTLAKVASYYENEVEQKTKDMSTVVEPFLMIIIGASVGFFALAMITPTYTLLGNVK